MRYMGIKKRQHHEAFYKAEITSRFSRLKTVYQFRTLARYSAIMQGWSMTWSSGCPGVC